MLSVVALGMEDSALPVAVVFGVGLAAVLTLAEGALGGGTDNVVLPVLGAGMLTLVT